MTISQPRYIKSVMDEFATVDILVQSDTTTGRTDAFVISWVKIEKQARRILSYLLYQFPAFTKLNTKDIENTISSKRNLYFETFIRGFDRLYPISFSDIVGTVDYTTFITELNRIKQYRNKILHGQPTGLRLTSDQLTREIILMKNWCSLVGKSMEDEINFDGFTRNSFRKNTSKDLSSHFRCNITNIAELNTFLDTLR